MVYFTFYNLSPDTADGYQHLQKEAFVKYEMLVELSIFHVNSLFPIGRCTDC
jgi:hypothetical protein